MEYILDIDKLCGSEPFKHQTQHMLNYPKLSYAFSL